MPARGSAGSEPEPPERHSLSVGKIQVLAGYISCSRPRGRWLARVRSP
jgi:hypothetical protein